LIDGVTLQIQKEKEDKIQEGQKKILEEFELHLEHVHVKYDGIISKDRLIKYQTMMIKDVIVSEKNIDETCVQNKEKPPNVKHIDTLITMKYFKENKKDGIIIIKE
jgi:hypothetical protein